MVDAESLWIGDVLRIKKSGKIGKFEGLHPSKKLRIRVGEKILLVSPGGAELVDEEDSHTPDLGLEEEAVESKPFQPGQNEIDLHIEVLAPHLVNQRAERILQFQLNACRQFIDEAWSRRKYSVRIIHGKGEGVLRSEVQHLLKLHPGVALYSSTVDEGSTDVIFKSTI